MPFVRIQLLKGRNASQKQEAARKIVEAITKELNCPKDKVKVIFEEMNQDDYFEGHKL